MPVVYVIAEIEKGVERPVGVVTDEAVANQFYQKDPENRDYVPFNLDEIPMLSGIKPNEIPEHPLAETVREQQERITALEGLVRQYQTALQDAKDSMNESNRLIQRILKQVQKK